MLPAYYSESLPVEAPPVHLDYIPHSNTYPLPARYQRALYPISLPRPINAPQTPSSSSPPIPQEGSRRRHPSHHAVAQPLKFGSVEHTEESDFWHLDIELYSDIVRITKDQVHQKQLSRSLMSFEGQLHDLLAGSLLPLTRHYPAQAVGKIAEQAKLFFASFDSNAHWYVDVENLQPGVGKVIHGLTPNSRKHDLASRFLRFRFPHVTFEWFIQTPHSEISSCTAESTVDVEILWKAWAREGAASGLVAYGSIKDTVRCQMLADQSRRTLVIIKRDFTIIQVFQPELMTPVPYPHAMTEITEEDDLLLFSTSRTVLQFLRSSQVRLGFLIAASALFSSLQPIAQNFSTIAGWITAGIGVFSGLISVVGVLFGWLLAWSERNVARRRQFVEKHG